MLRNQDDAEGLMQRFSRGDEQAFNALYREYYRPLRYFLFKVVGDDQEAADIVSESMLKLWKQREGFTRKEEVKSFLFTVSHRSALNALRDRKRHAAKEAELAEAMEATGHRNFFDQLVLAEFLAQVAAEVEKLPPGQRDVFKLTYFDGLATEEIAKALDISASAVYTNRKRALDALKLRFGQADPLFLLIFVQLFGP